MSEKKIILAYENIIAGNRGSLDWLLKTYIKDRQVDRGPIKALSPRTLVDYENYTRVLLSKKWFGRGGNPNLWSDKQYTTALKVTSEMRVPYMYAVMELQYLQGARFGEVQGIRISDCGDDGIHLKRSKGSKDEITEWTPRLRAVYDL